MRREIGAALRLLVLPSIALVAVAAFVPGRLPLAARVYALVVCAVALGIGLLALRRAYPPAAPLRRGASASPLRRRPPPTLARIEDEVALGVAGAFDLHHRLVPRLRSIAAGLLTSRRRVSLEASPEEARRALGDEAWELVRPDRPPPVDRQARGIPPEALGRVVDSLEAV
jgi:hypothetical protein